jgi:hypothetical protein
MAEALDQLGAVDGDEGADDAPARLELGLETVRTHGLSFR